MSFSKTIEQMRNRTKTVTRRDGWLDAKAGDRITAIEKGMGLKPGQKQVVIGEIEVVMVSREPLGAITDADCVREGFPGLNAAGFMLVYGKGPEHVVTRIEFIHVEGSAT